jgi:5'-nucleotidase
MSIAKSVPELDLIIGGHDHENMLFRSGENYTPIAKADANAKTVFVHRLTYNPETQALDITSILFQINDSIKEDPQVKTVIDDWIEKGYQGFRNIGFKPSEAVATIDFDFDGLESSVRSRPTNLTRLIADAMVHDAGNVEFAFINGGSIRIDDKLTAGSVTQYDVLRVLPFPGKVLSVNIKGSLLLRALNQLRGTIGSGAFLQTTANLVYQNNQWTLNGESINEERIYRAAINDFVANGRQSPLTYLNINVPGSGIELRGTHSDTRHAVIRELKRQYPVDPIR